MSSIETTQITKIIQVGLGMSEGSIAQILASEPFAQSLLADVDETAKPPKQEKSRRLSLKQVREMLASKTRKPRDTSNLISRLELSNNPQSLLKIFQEIQRLPVQKQALFWLAYKTRLLEIWANNHEYRKRYPTEEIFLAAYVAGNEIEGLPLTKSLFVQSLIDPTEVQLYPDINQIDELRSSRLYPLYSHEELRKIQGSTFFFIGCSTATPLILALARMGAKKIILSDFDIVETANTGRAFDQSQVGQNKALAIAQQILLINPNCDVQVYPFKLSLAELTKVIINDQPIIINEAIDGLETKLKIRWLLKALSKLGYKTPFLGMPTNIEDPVLSLERSHDPSFLRPEINEADWTRITKAAAQQNMPKFIKGVTRIIGVKYISPRQMVNFILFALSFPTDKKPNKLQRLYIREPEKQVRYISQDGISALISAGSMGRIYMNLIQGAVNAQSELQMSVRDMFDPASMKKMDEPYFAELQQNYQEIFGGFNNLNEALAYLVPLIFGEKYTYQL